MLEILNNFDKIMQRGSHEFEYTNYGIDIKKTIDSAVNFYSTSYKEGFNVIILLNLTLFVNIGYLIYLFSEKKIDINYLLHFLLLY